MSESNENGGPVLRARGLMRAYGDGPGRIEVLRGLDLDVARGERVAITGTSGAGKSTLLHLLGLIDLPDAGVIEIDGRVVDVRDERGLDRLRNRMLGFVYQMHHLLPEFTALENVCVPLWIRGAPAASTRDRAGSLLDRVGLAGRRDHLPAELSGGERQRVALARALAGSPACVLADEPTGNLDRQTGRRVETLMLDLAREERTAFLVVTHDPELAARMDRVHRLVDGRLVS